MKYNTLLLFFIMFSSMICAPFYSQSIDAKEKWIKVADGLDFPEGPAYDGKSSIFLSNCYGGWIAKYSGGVIDTFVSKLVILC